MTDAKGRLCIFSAVIMARQDAILGKALAWLESYKSHAYVLENQCPHPGVLPTPL